MKSISKHVMIIIVSALLVFIPCTAASASSSEQNGDIVKLSGDIYVNDGTTVTGNAIAINGNVYVDGVVNGDVVSIFGDVIVNNGKILGDAVTVSGKITVGQNGKIMGNTVEALGGVFGGGSYRHDNRPNISIPSWGFSLAGTIFSFIFCLVMFGLACIVYLIMPDKIERMASTITPNLGKRIGIGFLTLIGSPMALIIVSIILAITIIGIIVIPFVWIAFALAIFMAIVPVYVFIGRSVVPNNRTSGYLALATGMLLLWVVNTVLSLIGPFTSWINAIIAIGVFVLGTGTLLDFIFSNRKPRPRYTPNAQYPPQGRGPGGWQGDYRAPEQGQNNERQPGSIPRDDNK